MKALSFLIVLCLAFYSLNSKANSNSDHGCLTDSDIAQSSYYKFTNDVLEIVNTAYNGEHVVSIGSLTNYFGDDLYQFTDNNGNSIEVYFDEKSDWSNICKNMRISLYAIVKKNIFQTKLRAIKAVPCSIKKTSK